MNNIMLDIETMGTSSEAAILSIGACYFNPKTGEIGDTFYEKCSLKSSIDVGLVVDASTVIWWLQQENEARSEFYSNDSEQHINECLLNLASFIDENAQVWGNGSTFDNTIVKSAYKKALGFEPPWKFWNDRDVRTIVQLGYEIGFDPKKDLPFEGVKHNALSDAIHQAKYVSAIFQKLTREELTND